MIVILIIAVLLAIAIPNLKRARLISQEKACISNMDKIEGGKQQYALEHNKGDGDAVAWANIVPDYVKVQPACPAGGVYTVGIVGAAPECTVGGHELPWM